MTRKKLRELEQRISKHFYNEARIMKDMLESDLSKEEMKELNDFMLNHPFFKVSDLIQKKNEETRERGC